MPKAPAISQTPMNVANRAGRPSVAKLAVAIGLPINFITPPISIISVTIAIAAQITYFMSQSLFEYGETLTVDLDFRQMFGDAFVHSGCGGRDIVLNRFYWCRALSCL